MLAPVRQGGSLIFNRSWSPLESGSSAISPLDRPFPHFFIYYIKYYGIFFVAGEITMISPARVVDTEDGRYDLVIRATDAGTPTLHRDVKV